MASTDDTATAPALPDDVLVEILLLLPAKSVLRFRAVCKPWRLLLSDPVFIRDHHRRAPLALLLDDNCIDSGDAISALPLPCTDQSTAAPLHCCTTCPQTYLHGCCDGLLLFSCSCSDSPKVDANRYEFRYFICNPATRERARLPDDLGHVEIVGFYRHEPTADYRVLCHKKSDQIYEYLVAAPGQLTARRIRPSSNLSTNTDDWPLIDKPVAHRGCLHWMLWRPSMGTVVFDMISEEFRRMRGPVDGDTRMDEIFGGQLVGVDGTLGAALLDDSGGALKVWVLESYEKEAWSFRYNMDVSFLNPRWGLGSWSISLAHVNDEGDAVFTTMGRKLVGMYNIRRGEVVSATLEQFRGHLHATDHVYQESLMSLAS